MHTREDRSGLGTGNGSKNNWIARHPSHSLFFTTDAEIHELFQLFNQKFELNFRLLIRAFGKGRKWGNCNSRKKIITIFPEGRTVGVLLHEIAHAVVNKESERRVPSHGYIFYITFERVLKIYDRIS